MGPQNVMLLVLAAPCALSQTLPALRLRGVFAMNIDSGSNPGKAVHLYATQDIADLSSYSIGIANNGGGTDGSEFSLSGAAAAGDNIIVVRESLTPLVTSHLCGSQFQRQIIGSSKVSPNGDDAIELFHDTGSGPQLIDTFGDNSVDGTGQPWEYSQSWAYRHALSAGAFNLGEWTFGGVGCTASVSIDAVTTEQTSCPYPLCVSARPSFPSLNVLMLGNSLTKSEGREYDPAAMVIELTAGSVTTGTNAPGGWMLCQHAVCQAQPALCADYFGASSVITAQPAYNVVVLQPWSQELILEKFGTGDGTSFCPANWNPAFAPGHYDFECSLTPAQLMIPRDRHCGLCHGGSDSCAIDLVQRTEAAGARVVLAETWEYTDARTASSYSATGDAHTYFPITSSDQMFTSIQNGANLLKERVSSHSTQPVEIAHYGKAANECKKRFPTTMDLAYHMDGKHLQGRLGSMFTALTLLATLFHLTPQQLVSLAQTPREEDLAICAAVANGATDAQVSSVSRAAVAPPPSPPPPTTPTSGQALLLRGVFALAMGNNGKAVTTQPSTLQPTDSGTGTGDPLTFLLASRARRCIWSPCTTSPTSPSTQSALPTTVEARMGPRCT